MAASVITTAPQSTLDYKFLKVIVAHMLDLMTVYGTKIIYKVIVRVKHL